MRGQRVERDSFWRLAAVLLCLWVGCSDDPQRVAGQARGQGQVGRTEVIVSAEDRGAYEAYNFGVQLHGEQRLQDAVEAYQHAVRLKPDFAEAYLNCGLLLDSLGRSEEGAQFESLAFDTAPDDTMRTAALNNLGQILHRMAGKDLGRLQDAIRVFDLALALDPTNSGVLYNMGRVYDDMGHTERAREVYETALRVNPQAALPATNLGNYYLRQDDHLSAVRMYQRALQSAQSAKDKRMTWNNMGQAAREAGDFVLAKRAFRQALALSKEQDVWALGNLYGAQRYSADWFGIEAIEDTLQHNLTDWTKYEEGGVPTAMGPYFSTLLPHLPPSRELLNARITCRTWQPHSGAAALTTTLTVEDSSRHRLSVGYLSYDFREHPMGYLTKGLFAQHNASRVETTAISYGPGEDAPQSIHQSIRRDADRFMDQSTETDEWAAAAQIQGERIHILVDLMAHTRKSKPGRAALKPAPIVVNFLGFPGTTGCNAHDYYIADARGVPPDTLAPFFSEKIVYLPHTYQSNEFPTHSSLPPCVEQLVRERRQRLPDREDLSHESDVHRVLRADWTWLQHCTVEGHIRLLPPLSPSPSPAPLRPPTTTQADTSPAADESVAVCAFNALHKVEEPAWTTWMNALRRTHQGAKTSHLYVYAPVNEANGRGALRQEMHARGIVDHPKHVRFVGNVHKQDHLHRLTGCDVFLDTFTYGAHTTASDALWSMVPIVSLHGYGATGAGLSGRMQSRVSAALSSAACCESDGLRGFPGRTGTQSHTAMPPATLVSSVKEYEDTSVRVLRSAPLRWSLRTSVARAAPLSPLFNLDMTTHNLELAYQGMWELHSSPFVSRVMPMVVNPRADEKATRYRDLTSARLLHDALVALQQAPSAGAHSPEEVQERQAAARRSLNSVHRLLVAEPQASDGWHLRGVAHHQIGGLAEEAVRDLEQAVRLRPHADVFWTNLLAAVADSPSWLKEFVYMQCAAAHEYDAFLDRHSQWVHHGATLRANLQRLPREWLSSQAVLSFLRLRGPEVAVTGAQRAQAHDMLYNASIQTPQSELGLKPEPARGEDVADLWLHNLNWIANATRVSAVDLLAAQASVHEVWGTEKPPHARDGDSLGSVSNASPLHSKPGFVASFLVWSDRDDAAERQYPSLRAINDALYEDTELRASSNPVAFMQRRVHCTRSLQTLYVEADRCADAVPVLDMLLNRTSRKPVPGVRSLQDAIRAGDFSTAVQMVIASVPTSIGEPAKPNAARSTDGAENAEELELQRSIAGMIQDHAHCLFAVNQSERGVALLEVATRAAPQNHALLMKYGVALQSVSRFEEGLDALLRGMVSEQSAEYRVNPSIAVHRAAYLSSARHARASCGKRCIVAFYCDEFGQTWWPNWGPRSLDADGLGGSEEAVVFLSRELVKRGYHVEIYVEPPEEDEGIDAHGVAWYHHRHYNPAVTPADVFVTWRYYVSIALTLPEQLQQAPARERYLQALQDLAPTDVRYVEARRVLTQNAMDFDHPIRFYWTHDVIDQDRFLPSLVERFDGIWCQSKFHIRQLSAAAAALAAVIPNGINKRYIVPGSHDPNTFVYGSSPARGLGNLLQEWPHIVKALPQARLRIYYGFSERFLQHGRQNIAGFEQWLELIYSLLEQPGVDYIGMVSHTELAHAYANAGFILYPSTYPETGCTTIIKAMALGAIPVTTRYVESTIPDLTGEFDLGPPPLTSKDRFRTYIVRWTDHVIAAAQAAHRGELDDHRARMIEYARTHFDWGRSAGLVDALIDEKQR